MATANITPPTVLATIDYSTGKGENDIPLVWARNVTGYPADSAVEVGDAVSTVAPTVGTYVDGKLVPGSSNPLSVEPAASGTEGLVAGVALNSAAAGEIVRVADIGYVRSVGAAEGDGLSPNTGGVCSAGGALGATDAFVALGDDIPNFYDAVSATLVRTRSA